MADGYMDLDSGHVATATYKMKSVRGMFALIGATATMTGLVMQWSLGTDEWDPWSGLDDEINRRGMYCLFNLLVCLMNILAIVKNRSEYTFAAAVLYTGILTQNVCTIDLSKETWLRFTFGMAVGGAFLTFSALEWRLKLAKYWPVHLVLALTMGTGSALLWTIEDDACTAFPETLTLSAATSALYLYATLTANTAILELTLMLSAWQIYSFAPSPWPCDRTSCRVGLVMVFASSALTTLVHTFLSSKLQRTVGFSEVRLLGQTGLQLLCVVGALVGGVIVWTMDQPSDVPGFPNDHLYLAAALFVFVTLLMLWAHVMGSGGATVAAASVLVTIVGDESNQIVKATETKYRVALILLFFFSFVSMLGARDSRQEEREASGLTNFFHAGAVAFACVVYLWSESVYAASHGTVGLMLMLGSVVNCDVLFQWSFFAALVMLPALTPFTTTGDGGVPKLLANTIGLAFTLAAHHHIHKFGGEVYETLRFFKED